MFTFIVRPRMETVFDQISRRDVRDVVGNLAVDVHHRFAGNHALGGERHSRSSVNEWFERLFRLYPELTFEVGDVTCAGWPWALCITVEWVAEATPLHGERYRNVGTHIIRLRGTTVTHLHAYEDSQAVATSLDVMAAAGIVEASAAPITD